ncbi:MAG: glycine cleavage system aminomethyltransferase GcvT [Alphaproteobacteria bacterium]
MSQPESPEKSASPNKTALYDFHLEQGGKIVDFAGWLLPVNYKQGIIAEHLWCREKTVLFDVSHMGQIEIKGDGAAAALEKLVPSAIQTLKKGNARYTVLLNKDGGIEDDLIVANTVNAQDQDILFAVVNASRFQHDYDYLTQHLDAGIELNILEDQALLALQGPLSEAVLSALCSGVEALNFMETGWFIWNGVKLRVSRLGYTGEDGFEISLPAASAHDFANILVAHEDCIAAGLGARDSLRLEAGLCLYGNDLDDQITPVEANLSWIIQKSRRIEGGFKGAANIQDQLSDHPKRLLMGIQPQGRAPARRGVEILSLDGSVIGHITSGGFSPSQSKPVSMGFVAYDHAKADQAILLKVRDKQLPATLVNLPFVPHRYKRKSK